MFIQDSAYNALPLGEQSPQEAIVWKFKATNMQKNFHGMLKQVEY
jgi:hypothetical protein